MEQKEMRRLLEEQLSIDYNCTPEDFSNTDTLVTPLRADPEARKREEPLVFSMLSYRGKLVLTACPALLPLCESSLTKHLSAEWGFEARSLIAIDQALAETGYGIDQAHLFLTPKRRLPEADRRIKLLCSEEIAAFAEDARIDEAFLFSDVIEDVLGAALYGEDGELLAIAGASANSRRMWELGCNALSEGRGYAQAVSAALARAVLAEGRLPFCGTALSHLASLSVMLGMGFAPAFAELTGVRMHERAKPQA